MTSLIPPAGFAWHGVGQDPLGIAEYIGAVGPELRPAIVSAYTAIHPLWTSFAQWRGYTRDELVAQFEAYPDCIHHLAVPMGVSRPNEKSTPWTCLDLIIKGSLDTHLRDLARLVGQLRHPVLLRPGFEFNGDWNGYDPALYIPAFRRVVDVMRDVAGERIAWVWHGVTHTPGLPEWMRWYPGDDYVDWFGLSTFSQGHLGDVKGGAWIRDAEAHGKPLMICESTPMKFDIATQADEAWAGWYAHLFDFVARYNACRAFVYINQNLAQWPMWKDFGDSRLHRSPAVLKRYRAALQRPGVLHARALDV